MSSRSSKILICVLWVLERTSSGLGMYRFLHASHLKYLAEKGERDTERETINLPSIYWHFAHEFRIHTIIFTCADDRATSLSLISEFTLSIWSCCRDACRLDLKWNDAVYDDDFMNWSFPHHVSQNLFCLRLLMCLWDILLSAPFAISKSCFLKCVSSSALLLIWIYLQHA